MLFIAGHERASAAPAPAPVIPDGAIWERETLRRVHPPAGFDAVLIWYHAATLSTNHTGDSARIIVDYMRLIEKDADGNERIMWAEDYTAHDVRPLRWTATGPCEGGLYRRFPKWFVTDDNTPIPHSEIRDGHLTLDAGPTPDKILHWWTGRVSSKPDARYYSELRVKIESGVGLQIGSDYWRSVDSPYNYFDNDCAGSNNCEAWISDWYGDTGGEFVVIRSPNN